MQQILDETRLRIEDGQIVFKTSQMRVEIVNGMITSIFNILHQFNNSYGEI